MPASGVNHTLAGYFSQSISFVTWLLSSSALLWLQSFCTLIPLLFARCLLAATCFTPLALLLVSLHIPRHSRPHALLCSVLLSWSLVSTMAIFAYEQALEMGYTNKV